MNNWYSRPVFFVRDVEASLAFYINKLDFTQDWVYEESEKIIVAQVSRDALEIILNKDVDRVGTGRVFISLHDEHVGPLQQQIEKSGVAVTNKFWGMRVSEILDIDRNELLFSPPISS